MLFPTQSSVLDSHALGRLVVSRYRLPGPLTCRFFRKGMTDTYEMRSPSARYFLKVYMHGRRNRADVEDEVHLLNYLDRHGVSVAVPLRRTDGGFVTSLRAPEGKRYAVIFRSAEGGEANLDRPDHCAALGRLIGRLHRVSDGMRGTYQRTPVGLEYLIDRQIENIRPFMVHRQADFDLIRAIGAEVTGKVSSLLGQRRPEYGICHGDLHGSDVRIDRRGKATVFDFDSSGYGWRAIEIGVFYATHEWMDVSPKAEGARKRRLSAFLRGYQRERRLSAEELEVVRLGPPVRHIYLMGVVLEYSSTYQGFHWADDRFLDWHMAWFRHWATHGSRRGMTISGSV